MVALTIHGKVLEGRCLNCNPIDSNDTGVTIPAVSRPATEEDLRRFRLKQEQLRPASDRNLPNVRASGRPTLHSRSSTTSTSSLHGSNNNAGYDRAFSMRSLPAHRSSSIGSMASFHSAESSTDAPPYRGPERPPEDVSSYRNNRRRSTGDRYEAETHRTTGGGSQDGYSEDSSRLSNDSGSQEPAVDEFRTSMERILGYRVDEEEAYALLSSGREPSQILEDLRRKHQNTERRYAEGDNFSESDPRSVGEGSLNRGDAVDFHSSSSGLSTGYSNRSLNSHGGNYHSEKPVAAMMLSGREHSSRSIRSEIMHGRERLRQLRRGSNSSVHSEHSYRGLSNLSDHFSRQSISPSGEIDRSSHDDAYSTGELSRSGHQMDDLVRRRSEGSLDRSLHDDTEGGLDRLTHAGADFAAIVSIMRDYPGSAEVQLNCMEELSSFNFTDEDFDMLLTIGAMEVVADAMQAFPQDIVLQMSGCRALCNTSGTLEVSMCYAELGAVDIVLDCMGLFLEDPRMQEQGLAALAILAAAAENVPELLDKGCLPQTVAAMNKYTADMEVQLRACSLLSVLASHSPDVGNAIMEANGGGAVVLAMVIHSQEPDIQEKALRALLNLVYDNDDIKTQLAHMGGIDAAIQAMQVHRDDAVIQECAASMLFNLADIPENKVLIGQCGGIDVTIRAMWVHSESVSVTEWCCKALFAVSLDPENARKILEIGGITALVNAMQAHSESALVQEMCCAVLCSLATNDDAAKEKIVAEEALDAIVLAMVLFGDDVGVQEQACLVLLQLANETNLRSMQASNVGELALTAANNHPERCREIAEQLSQILEGLVAEYNSNSAAITAS